ncbi:hypothetical protein SCHPADRAFT_902857 [Schizopora paradoxa]|uniref:Uncharacterized protein n=1 Tax=Schizopora paradoxa TaxID=27342 RepID=A0A0H2RZA1_9AGAM|nr:hypothetical protein SCHPADRAFT_902857 [Schizopora paradoxa]
MSPYERRQVTTTTTFISVPTIAVSSSGSGVSVPVAAIVGGVCAGVVLAIAAVVGWKLWGRSIERQQRAERERRAIVAQRRASQQRASLSRQQTRSRRSSSSGPNAKASSSRVKFVDDAQPISFQRNSSDTGSSGTTVNSPAIDPDRLLNTTTNSVTPPIAVQSRRSSSQPPSRPLLIKRPTNLRPSPLAPSSFSRPSPLRPSIKSSLSDTRRKDESAGHDEKKTAPKDIEKDAVAAATSSQLSSNVRTKRSWGSLLDPSLNRSSVVSASTNSNESTQRWSWRSLFTGPGVSFGQGLGVNRLSADTSSQYSWPDLNSSVPIGVAIGGLDGIGGTPSTSTDPSAIVKYPKEYFQYCAEGNVVHADK